MPNSRSAVRIIRSGAGNGQSRAKGLSSAVLVINTILLLIITGITITIIIIIFTQSVITIFVMIITVIITL